MKFIRYSITFKVLFVGLVLASIFETGIRIEGEGKSFPAVLVGGFNQIFSTIPVPYGIPDSLIFALTNGFFFYGSFLCLFIVHKLIRQGSFIRTGWKSFAVLLILAIFSISCIWHYADMFFNQERKYYSERDNIFATTKSQWALNAYDNFIAIAIVLQIAQATLNTGLKRVFKREVSA